MAAIGNSPTQQAFTPAIDYFSGNGSTTAFTLSRPVASVAQVQVTIDNVAQNPSSAFTVSANTITFTSAPLSGTNNIYVYYTSPITQVIAPGQGTVTSDSFGTITNFTTTGNTVLGDATTDTLTVGVTGIVKDSSGNVGIGNTTPSSYNLNAYKLVIGSNSAVTGITLASGTGAAGNIFFARGTTGADAYDGYVQYAQNGQYMAFGTSGGTERMRIDSSGNLLVGQTSSTDGGGICVSKSVNGSTIANFYNNFGSGSQTLRTSMAGAASNTSSYHIVCASGADKFFVYGNGNVVNSNNSYGTLSDVKLKENIVDASSKLAEVMQLKVRNFNLKTEPEHKQIGFIAQELEQVFPALIDNTTSPNDPDDVIKSIKTSVLVPILVKAIQELKAINDTQAETINALTARIVALENR